MPYISLFVKLNVLLNVLKSLCNLSCFIDRVWLKFFQIILFYFKIKLLKLLQFFFFVLILCKGLILIGTSGNRLDSCHAWVMSSSWPNTTRTASRKSRWFIWQLWRLCSFSIFLAWSGICFLIKSELKEKPWYFFIILTKCSVVIVVTRVIEKCDPLTPSAFYSLREILVSIKRDTSNHFFIVAHCLTNYL